MRISFTALCAFCLVAGLPLASSAQSAFPAPEKVVASGAAVLDLASIDISKPLLALAPASEQPAAAQAPAMNSPTTSSRPARNRAHPPAFAWHVFSEICKSGVREPQIVMRQALLETGHFRSGFLMQRNNLFGFRAQNYLRFGSWQDSVRYYRDWQARHHKPSDKSYYSFLSRIRYGAPTYPQHLRKVSWNHDCTAVTGGNAMQLVSAPSPLRAGAAAPTGG